MTTDKCAHPACDCQVPPGGPFGKYCCEHCKHAGKITELRCNCQHPECREAGQVQQPRQAQRLQA
jgi:hypothetical protein